MEVEEAVGIDVEHVAGAVPAVGREDLGALTPVVALHERRPAEPQLAGGADRHVLQRVGIDDPRREAGHRQPEGTAPVLGLVGLVAAHEAHAARLGGAEHVVAQLEVGGTDRLRQERMQVARADRREVTGCERRVRDQRRDRRRVPVGELRPLAFDEVERLDGIRGRGAQQRGPGHEHADDVVRETADPEHRRVREEPVPASRPRMPFNVSRCPSSAPCWWITPFGALVDPDVCTMIMRSSGVMSSSTASSTASGTSAASASNSRTRRATPGGGAARPWRHAVADGGRRRRRARRRSRCPGRRRPHDEVDVGARQQVAQLARRGEGADRDGDGADAHRGQPGQDVVDPGREEQTDPAPAPGPGREQAASEEPAAPFGVGVGEAVVVAHDVVGVGSLRDVGAQRPADGGRSGHGRRADTAGSARGRPSPRGDALRRAARRRGTARRAR